MQDERLYHNVADHLKEDEERLARLRQAGVLEEGEIYSLLIDLSTKKQYKIFDGVEPAYKASLFYGQLEYAQKTGESFEHRQIVMAENPQIKPTNIVSMLKVKTHP